MAVPVGCAHLPLGAYTEPFLHTATLVPSTTACSFPPCRPGQLHFFLPDSPSVFNPARRRRPSPPLPWFDLDWPSPHRVPRSLQCLRGCVGPGGREGPPKVSGNGRGRSRGHRGQAGLADCDHRCYGNPVTWLGRPPKPGDPPSFLPSPPDLGTVTFAPVDTGPMPVPASFV